MSKIILIGTTMIGSAAIAFSLSTASFAGNGDESGISYHQGKNLSIQLGPRPFF